MDSIKGLTSLILKFRDDRDWKQFHSLKDLAVSVAVEAAELLQEFQWKREVDLKASNLDKTKLADEIADVAIGLFELSSDLDIDVGVAISQKLKKNGEKYPISKAKGNNLKYSQL